MQPHQGAGGRSMNSSQLQELQEMQRIQQEMQSRLQRQQQRPSSQVGGGLVSQQQQSAQLGNQQRWMGQQMGNQQQQGTQRSSFPGGMNANEAMFLMQQQQQRSASGGLSNSTNGTAQNALYWNVMQAQNSSSGHQAMGNSQSSINAVDPLALSAQQRRGSDSSAQGLLLQQQQQQQQQMAGSSSSLLGALSGSQPQLAAGSTSDQLLMQQQSIMAQLRRKLQNQQGSGEIALGGGGAHQRRTSSSSTSSSVSQRQAMFQMQQQRQNSLTNVLGGGGVSMPANQPHNNNNSAMSMSQNSPGVASLPPAQDRRSSIGSVEPISLATLMETQQQQPRRGSSGSLASAALSHLFREQQQPAGSSDPASMLLQQQLLSGILPGRQDTSQSQQLPGSQARPVMSGSGSLPLRSTGEMPKRGLSVDSNATAKRSNKTAKPKNTGESSTTGRSYMEGTFEGGWQSNADLPERREVIFSIVKLVEQMRPDSDKASQKLPQMAKRLEEHLYRSARTKQEYLDSRTLKRRLQNVAHGLEVNRPSAAGGESVGGGSHSQTAQRDVGLTEAERRTKSLQQQLQHLQQLQKLQQQGAVDDYLSQQATLLQMQQAGVASQPVTLGQQVAGRAQNAPAGLSQVSGAEAAAGHPGILKTTSKYQDPATPRKKKVIQQQQQRLLLLRHASKCKAGSACKNKHCSQMVELWKHMKKCRDKNCKTSHCLSSRCVLNHYRMCKNANTTSTCEICAPVMQQVKMQQISDEASDAALKDDSQEDLVPAKLPASPTAPRGAMGPDSIEHKRRQLEELEAAQQKLQQQQTLLKQINQQQIQNMEKQEQLRLEQQRVQPQTEQGVQLQQQQVLLQQLNDLFQQQQFLLQQEVTSRSQTVQEVRGLSVSHAAMEPVEEVGRTSSILEGTSSSSSPSRRTSQRGRGGGKGKRLNVMAPVASEHGRNVAKPLGGTDESASPSRKRAADRKVAEPELDGAGDTRSTKVARVEKPEPRPKVLQQGSADHTTSLIQSMSVAAVERHLASLNDKLHITPQTVSQRCLPVIRKLIDDQFGWVFSDPVDPVALGLPDYFEIVRNPMHLSLVEEKLRRGEYHDMDSFARETRLVFNNAILYNGGDSEVGEMAALMLRHFEKDLKAVQKGIDRDQRSLQKDDACVLCGTQRRLFEPTTLYCNGACGMQRIRRNANYYTDHTKLNHWCVSCFAELDDQELILLEDGSEVRKSALQKFKNDGLPEEAWVQCDECSGWVHQICALFNGRRNKNAASYRCPKCYIDKSRHGELGETEGRVMVAEDLPHCNMSRAIEDGLHKTLASAYEDRASELGVDVSEVEKADGLFVRVVSNMEKKHVVRDEMHKRYAKDGCASDFPVRSKCIALFQTVDGVDVILFAMYVYEYDDSCPSPNRRRVYVSYLDSVYYFQPKCYRTIAYHSLIVEYLRYVKERGFHTAHIWSCPPSEGDDYVFYSHPKEQLVPREEMLLQWYHRMLEKATEEGIVLETRTLYDEYFSNNGMNAPSGSAVAPTCLPYFEGDYIPGEIENIIKLVEDESKNGAGSDPGEIGPGSQDKVMRRLGEAMYNMRQNFMVARLRSKDFVAAVDNGEDVTDWVDADGDATESPSKRVKIGSKDSNCLSQLPVHQQKLLTAKIAEMTENDGQGQVEVAGAKDDQQANTATTSDAAVDATKSPKTVDGGNAQSREKEAPSGLTPGQGDERANGTTQGSSVTSLLSTDDDGNHDALVDSAASSVTVKRAEVNELAVESTGDCQGPEQSGEISAEPTKSPDQGKEAPSSGTKDESLEAKAASDVSKEKDDEKTQVEPTSPEVSGDPTQSQESVKTTAGSNDPSVSVSSVSKAVGLDSASTVNETVKGSHVTDGASPVTGEAETPEVAAARQDESGVPASEKTDSVPAIPAEAPAPSDLSAQANEQATPLKRGIEEVGPALSRHFASARSNAKPVGTTADEDEPQELEMFESRQQFLNYCQANHFQFDELRRAKHSTMMVLFQLHNPSAPMFLQQCGACYRDITHGTRYHCRDCSNFDLCQDCYEPVTTGLWAKRDSRFTHNKRHVFVAIDMEANTVSQKSREDRTKAIKLHLELLSHAATCDGPPGCALNNCQRMKKLFEHVKTCEVTYRKGCKVCLRLLSLLTIHARMCTVRGACPLPFCDRIRERNKRRKLQQQLMDDRRRQAQNELYARRGSGAPAK